MAKHIFVFGSPGSGKSVFSAALAKEAAKQKKRTIIVSGDIVIPMLPFFSGNSDTVGLGLLCAGEITPQTVAESVKVIKEYPDIGVMGLQFDDYPVSITSDQLLRISKQLDEIVDLVVWDGSSDMNTVFNQTMSENTDISVCILTADRKGFLFYENHRQMIRDIKNCFFLEGLAKPYSLYENLHVRVGGIKGRLYYGREIENICMEGDLFSIDKVCHESYRDIAERVVMQALQKGDE